MNRLKPLRVIVPLAIGLLVAVSLLYGAYQRSFYLAKGQVKRSPISSQPYDRHVMRGLRYNANLNDNTRLSIEAEEFRVGKRKIGF